MELYDFSSVALDAGLQMKDTHTIIDPWPMRVPSSSLPTSKDKELFALLLASQHTGQERFVEWKLRVQETVDDGD